MTQFVTVCNHLFSFEFDIEIGDDIGDGGGFMNGPTCDGDAS